MVHEDVKEAWQEYWAKNRDRELVFDEMSNAIFSEILKNTDDLKGKKILEAGCGRGLISAEIAGHGAEVYLLDISTEALQIAERLFSSINLKASFIHADILDMPFGDSTFDVVWNAGVMEHFEDHLRARAVRSIARAIKPGGFFITFNPSEKAFFYRTGKRIAEQRGIWPYGPEFPVKSLRGECEGAGLKVLKEYEICFKENLSYLSYASKHLRSMVKLLLKPFPEGFLIRVFGGYLLVTVSIKQQ